MLLLASTPKNTRVLKWLTFAERKDIQFRNPAPISSGLFYLQEARQKKHARLNIPGQAVLLINNII